LRIRLACLACLFLGASAGCSWLVGVSEDPVVVAADSSAAADGADASDASDE
jgi:hypothetical protein